MADRIENSEPLPELHAVVEAFLDGEIVDPSSLRVALGDKAARDHFVDLLIIRGAVHQMDSIPLAPGHARHDSRGRRKWLAAVAAAAIVSVLGGYVAGQRVMASTTTPATVEAVVFDSVPAAPKPTRSITFKPGLNWTDSSGGR